MLRAQRVDVMSASDSFDLADSARPSVAACFPSSDVRFRNHVRSVLSALTESGVSLTAERLRLEIAKTYPEVIIHEKHEMAGFGFDRVYYAYRDRDGVGPAPGPASDLRAGAGSPS
jgi:hypothetical protein